MGATAAVSAPHLSLGFTTVSAISLGLMDGLSGAVDLDGRSGLLYMPLDGWLTIGLYDSQWSRPLVHSAVGLIVIATI